MNSRSDKQGKLKSVSKVQVRRLGAADVEDFRAIRLAALQKAPEMFGSVYEREAKKPVDTFLERLNDVVAFGAYVDGKIVGLSVFKQEDGPKDAHKGHLSGVFVEPEQRSRGIADRLLRAVIDYACEHVEQILLTVVEGNVGALRLYEKHGFRMYGVEPRALKNGSEYRDEILMALILNLEERRAPSPKMLPQASLQDFASGVINAVAVDGRFIGLLAGGSAITGNTDAYSDLDLILVVRDDAYADVLTSRRRFADTLGNLLYAFTGEHVGESRLLICLYGKPVLHVDLKFVTIDDLDQRIENPLILWDSDEMLAARLSRGSASWPNKDAEWFEERFWVWVHYAATKLGRGELFEVIDMLAFLRGHVLGPLALRRVGADQRGVRHIEVIAPHVVTAMAETVGSHSVHACGTALRNAIRLYMDLRQDCLPMNRHPENEAEVLAYVEGVIDPVCRNRVSM
ncbi:TPA: GNAT family N-acetyltransferase [Pseudomonas aeruginosa]|nr:GNAT family N-acetyltransferase [Pseudomonas aeruginosa]